jgi:uncharacterized Rmd1/YagE family protein
MLNTDSNSLDLAIVSSKDSDTSQRLSARAFFVGERIDLRALESTDPLATNPFTCKAGQSGFAVLFRYGAVILFNLKPLEEASFLTALKPFVSNEFAEAYTENSTLIIDSRRQERVDQEGIHLQDSNVERLQIVAGILAKSVVLDHYEKRVAGIFDRIEPLAVAIQNQGRQRPKDRELLRHIGGTLLMEQRMVGLVEIGEKPEALWENPDLERLYLKLEDEYELRDRFRALDRKLVLITKTAETALELMQHDSNQRLEWYIVILIIVEILLNLYSMFRPVI